MTTEMTRRVGGAILLAEMEWTPKSPLSKEETMACAAIEAMREPTEAMISAGKDADWVGEVESRAGLSIMPDNTPDWNSDDDQAVISRPGIWQAMIAAALE